MKQATLKDIAESCKDIIQPSDESRKDIIQPTGGGINEH